MSKWLYFQISKTDSYKQHKTYITIMAFEQLEDSEAFYQSWEPMMKNRFQFRFADQNIPAFLIKSGSRPSLSYEEVELPHLNVTRKVQGAGVTYDNISLTLYDPISPSGSQAVMEWARQHHEPTTGREGYADVYKRDVIYNTLDPNLTRVEEWVLKGAFVVSASFGDVDFSSRSEFHEISLDIAYDYAVKNY